MNIMGLEITWPLIWPTERRKAERARTHGTLAINVNSPLQMISGNAEGRDISILGIRFASFLKLSLGTPIEVTLQFSMEADRETTIRAHAHVLRCYRRSYQSRYRVACAFDDLDSASCDDIQSYVSWLRKSPHR